MGRLFNKKHLDDVGTYRQACRDLFEVTTFTCLMLSDLKWLVWLLKIGNSSCGLHTHEVMPDYDDNSPGDYYYRIRASLKLFYIFEST